MSDWGQAVVLKLLILLAQLLAGTMEIDAHLGLAQGQLVGNLMIAEPLDITQSHDIILRWRQLTDKLGEKRKGLARIKGSTEVSGRVLVFRLREIRRHYLLFPVKSQVATYLHQPCFDIPYAAPLIATFPGAQHRILHNILRLGCVNNDTEGQAI